jgi:hypothetical protein
MLPRYMQRRNKKTIKYGITEFNIARLLCMLIKACPTLERGPLNLGTVAVVF